MMLSHPFRCLYVGGGGGKVYKKIIGFYLANFGIEHKKHLDDIFYTFLETVIPHFVIEYIQDET